MRREGREPLPDHAGESPLLSRTGGEKGLRGSGAGTLGVPLEGTRRVGGLLGVAGRLSGSVSPFRAEQGTSLETPWRARASSCQEVTEQQQEEKGLFLTFNIVIQRYLRLYSEENVNHLFLSQIKGNTVIKNTPTNARESCGSLNAGDAASIPGLGRPPGVGNGHPL